MSMENLPDDVGRKIVEALKNQSSKVKDVGLERDVTAAGPIKQQEDIKMSDNKTSESILGNNFDQSVENRRYIDSQDVNTGFKLDLESMNNGFNQNNYSFVQNGSMLNSRSMFESNEIGLETIVPQIENLSNVSILKNLVKQLPSGVTRQTGAQIIRQTLEALGISMNSVLQEAQSAQDSLNNAIKECLAKSQEYKNNAILLEKQSHEYKKQMIQLNDLISLFIMTDK